MPAKDDGGPAFLIDTTERIATRKGITCSRCMKRIRVDGTYYNDPNKSQPILCASCEKASEAKVSPLDDGGPASEKSLRDEFAGLAMQQWASARDFQVWAMSLKNEQHELLAKGAYRIADAMLAERAKQEIER